jgi:hypothetical protein
VIAFSQPFGISEKTGGARILRALIEPAPTPVKSIVTSLNPPPSTTVAEEKWLPRRPHLGRIERSRFARYLGVADLALDRFFQEKLRRELAGAHGIHCIAQNHDFSSVWEVAQRIGLPYVLTIHDDLRHSLDRMPEKERTWRIFGEIWRNASGRTVISDQMGEEYCRHHGERPFEVITDGIAHIPEAPLPHTGEARVYYMGSMAFSYQTNFERLFEILNGRSKAAMVFRGTAIESTPPGLTVERRGWAPEAEVARDFETVDVCYLPLPFGRDDWTRFSLSTKLVTYLGSGRPILYHGPADSAVALLLKANGAGVIVDSLDSARVAAGLAEVIRRGPELAAAALTLVRKRFRLADQRSRFWSLFGVA